MDALSNLLINVLIRIEWATIVYFLLLNSLYGVLLLSACAQMRKHLLATRGENLSRVLGSQISPHLSILAPAHEEAATITESVRALLAISYPNLEMIVINDGSRDDTLQVLVDQFELVPVHPIYQELIPSQPIKALYRSRSHPNLVVADKENGGKADALNAGLNLATGDLVCAIDADTLIEPDALQRMVRPFLTGDEVLAAGGTIRLVNGS
ncbi:MAG: glycosyltransferase family 2 protein, partial [Dehalococcoidia bacterium]